MNENRDISSIIWHRHWSNLLCHWDTTTMLLTHTGSRVTLMWSKAPLVSMIRLSRYDIHSRRNTRCSCYMLQNSAMNTTKILVWYCSYLDGCKGGNAWSRMTHHGGLDAKDWFGQRDTTNYIPISSELARSCWLTSPLDMSPRQWDATARSSTGALVYVMEPVKIEDFTNDPKWATREGLFAVLHAIYKHPNSHQVCRDVHM